MVKVLSWYIDGFGIFTSYKGVLSEAPFVVVYGDNEAGKSTLFSFFRGMLSSFPGGRQSKENKYIPRKGGTHGGYITLSFESTQIKIACSIKDKLPQYELIEGNETSLEKFKDFFDTLERDHFKSIFAFDVEELTRLSLLEDDSLNETLFSSSISGSTSIITTSSTRLKDRCKELLKPKSKGILQNLDEKLILISERKKKLLLEVKRSEEIRKTIESTESEIISLEKSISDLDFALKGQEQNERLSALKKQLDDIQSKVNELNEHRLPEEEHIAHFYTLRAKGQVLSEDDINQLPSLESLENDLKELLKKKEHLLALYSLLEEIQNKNSEIILYDDNADLATRKKRFFISFSFLCALIAVILFFFNETLYGISFIFFTLVSSLLYLASRRALGSLQSNIEQEIARKHALEEEIERGAATLDLTEVSDESLELAILKIDREVQNSTFKIDRTKERIENDTTLRTSFQNEMKEFLQSFSCGTADAFEERMKVAEKIKYLNTRKEELENILAKEGSTALIHAKELPEFNGLPDFHKKKELLQSTLREAISKNSEYTLRLTELANSDALQACLLEEEFCIKEFNDALNEWRAGTLAVDLLERSLHTLVESKYKDVLERAGEILLKITSGSYEKISVSPDKNELNVIHVNGSTFTTRELSRGTIEQVYVSVRLALAEHFGKTFYPMPVLLDDILVNFDRHRAKKMLEVLKEISDTHQIIFFTCHEWIRELIKETVPSYTEVVLEK